MSRADLITARPPPRLAVWRRPTSPLPPTSPALPTEKSPPRPIRCAPAPFSPRPRPAPARSSPLTLVPRRSDHRATPTAACRLATTHQPPPPRHVSPHSHSHSTPRPLCLTSPRFRIPHWPPPRLAVWRRPTSRPHLAMCHRIRTPTRPLRPSASPSKRPASADHRLPPVFNWWSTAHTHPFFFPLPQPASAGLAANPSIPRAQGARIDTWR